MPEFMKGPKSRIKRKPKKVESDSDEEWTPYKSTRGNYTCIFLDVAGQLNRRNHPNWASQNTLLILAVKDSLKVFEQ